MKLFLPLLALALFSTAAQAETCFQASREVPGSLPAELCLESARYVYEGNQWKLVVEGGNMAGTYSMVKRIVGFKAFKVLFRNGDGACAAREGANLELFSPFASDQAIDLGALKVSATYSSTSDSCHIQPEVEAFGYSIKE